MLCHRRRHVEIDRFPTAYPTTWRVRRQIASQSQMLLPLCRTYDHISSSSNSSSCSTGSSVSRRGGVWVAFFYPGGQRIAADSEDACNPTHRSSFLIHFDSHLSEARNVPLLGSVVFQESLGAAITTVARFALPLLVRKGFRPTSKVRASTRRAGQGVSDGGHAVILGKVTQRLKGHYPKKRSTPFLWLHNSLSPDSV